MSARRLRLALVPSPLLAAAILGAHGVAAGCVVLVLPGLPGALLAAAVAALGVAAAWRLALLRAPSSIRAIELEGAKALLVLAGGASIPAEVGARRYVGRFAVALAVRRPVRRTILVTRDMLDADSFRKLRVWALWGRLPAVAAKQLPA